LNKEANRPISLSPLDLLTTEETHIYQYENSISMYILITVRAPVKGRKLI